ncbi:hypothetical protein [Endozoicomonas sp.]|uniref:hypothetical protein n=1 Tax=Endozoicomonas sp. TaxID=1892382 RepID=UPI003AF9740E
MILLNIAYNSRCSGDWDHKRKTPHRPEKGHHIWGVVCRMMGFRNKLEDIIAYLQSSPDQLLSKIEICYVDNITKGSNDLTRAEKAYYSNSKRPILPIQSELRNDGLVIDEYKPFNILSLSCQKRHKLLELINKEFPDIHNWITKTLSVDELPSQRWKELSRRKLLENIDKTTAGQYLNRLQEFLRNESSLLWNNAIYERINASFHPRDEVDLKEWKNIMALFIFTSTVLFYDKNLSATCSTAPANQIKSLYQKIDQILGNKNENQRKCQWNKLLSEPLVILAPRDYAKAIYKDAMATTQLYTTPATIQKLDGEAIICLQSKHSSHEKRLEHEERIQHQLKSSGVYCFNFGKKGLAYVKSISAFVEAPEVKNQKHLGELSSLSYKSF